MASTTGSDVRSDIRPSAADRNRYEDESTHGYGWVIFAGTMIAIVGTLNFIYGIAAISNSKFYARDVTYVVSSLNTWGWVMLIIGTTQLFAGAGIWMQAPWARVVGILTASVNMIIQMMVLPAYPFLAMSLFAIDALVIYGLVAYGGRTAHR